MQVYGIRVTNYSKRVFGDESSALAAAREAIAKSIGIDNVTRTRTSHSLDETFFFVPNEGLAIKAAKAVDSIQGIRAEYVPLNIHEEAEIYLE